MEWRSFSTCGQPRRGEYLRPAPILACRVRLQTVAAFLAAVTGCGLSGCGDEGTDRSATREVIVQSGVVPETPQVAAFPAVRFVDVTDAAGLDFQHANGAFGKHLLPETMGSGVAFLDYDNDGDQDLLLVNSCDWPGQGTSGASPPSLALYRNRGDGKFAEATDVAGLGVTMYGMGVTVGDYDDDGWVDLFITGVGGCRLFRNASDDGGGRRFEDRTATSGVGGAGGWPVSGEHFLAIEEAIGFSSSAAFLDYDNDGRLDLFVCNYVTWSPAADLGQGFQFAGLGRSYGPPTAFDGANCQLYRNADGERFEDVSRPAGIQVAGPLGQPIGKALGVIVFDPDDDGWPDIVVANDTVRNFLFHNTKRGAFEEIGQLSGVAYAEGIARGAMGIDWGEYRPGIWALLIGNFADEPNTLLRLDDPRQLFFSDVAIAERMAGPSRMPLKFGALFFDYDLDGWQDAITCNGHLEPRIGRVQPNQTFRQPAQLFWNGCAQADLARDGCFISVPERTVGPDLFLPIVGRGCAYGDIDNDGDLDLVLTQNGGPARLLRNDGGNANHWLRIALVGDGRRSNTSAIGAKVKIEANGLTAHREVASARGYLSQSETIVTFGLGKRNKVDRLTIRWPGRDGGEQVLTDLAVDRVYVVEQRETARPEVELNDPPPKAAPLRTNTDARP